MLESNRPQNQENEVASGRQQRFFSIGFWLIGLLGLLLVGVVAFLSSYFQDTKDRVVFLIGSLLNALVFMAIVFQAFIYRKQWDTMEGQWNATRKLVEQNERVIGAMQSQLSLMQEAQHSFTIGERAYLVIEDIVFIEKGKRPQIVLTLFNGGRTPAFEVETETEASIGPQRKPPVGELQSFGHLRGDKAVIPASTKKQVVAEFPNFTVTLQQWQTINAGLSEFFVRGVVHYVDFRESRRSVSFCFGHDPSLNRFREYRPEKYCDDPN